MYLIYVIDSKAVFQILYKFLRRKRINTHKCTQKVKNDVLKNMDGQKAEGIILKAHYFKLPKKLK